MPSGTIAPSPPGSPLRQRVRIPRHLLRRTRSLLISVLPAAERLDDDCLRHIAAMVPLIEHGTLACCAAVSSAWRRVFAARIGTVLERLESTIEEQQSDVTLRPSTLCRERRRALRTSLDDPEALTELLTTLRGFRGEFVLGQEAQRYLRLAMRVTTALASTVLSATDDPCALSHTPSALLPNEPDRAGWWVIEFAVPGDVAGGKSGEMFVWEALEHADAHLERRTPWPLLAGSPAWKAVMEAASSQPWFVAHGLSEELATVVPLLDTLVRWGLAVMDEVGFMMMHEEVRAADAVLREHAALLCTLQERRRTTSTRSGRGHARRSVLRGGVSRATF